MENQAELFQILETAFRKKTLAEWRERFDQVNMLWASVQTPKEVIDDPQVIANDIVVPFEHEEFGPIRVIANPVKLSQAPSAIHRRAPEFSEHTEEILLELGYSWEEIAQLQEEGVIA